LSLFAYRSPEITCFTYDKAPEKLLPSADAFVCGMADIDIIIYIKFFLKG